MKITVQNTFNECGICVAHMLINYYGNTNITKTEVAQHTKLAPSGLSLKDLEDLCSLYNVELDTYEVTWQELISHHNRKPFVMVLNYGAYQHYVIGEIKHQKMLVYNPDNTVLKQPLNKPLAKFSGVVCFTNFKKQPEKIPCWNTQKLFHQIFNGFSCLFILTGILEFALEIIVSFYTTKIMNVNPHSLTTDSLWKLSLIFLLLLSLHYSFNFFNYLIKTWYFKRIYKNGMRQFLDLLLQKNLYFYKTFNKFEILQNISNIPKLLHFSAYYLSDCLSELFISAASSIVLLFLNRWYGIIIASNTLIVLIVNFFLYKNNKQLIEKTWKRQFLLEHELNNFFDYSQTNQHQEFQQRWLDNLQQELFEQNNLHINFSYRNKVIHFFTEFVLHLLNYLVLLISWNLSFNQPGQIFLALTIFHLNSSSVKKVITTFFEYFNIKPLYKKMQDLLAQNNQNQNNVKNGYALDKIETLKLNGHLVSKNLSLNYKNLSEWPYFDYLIKQKSYEGLCLINDVKLECYNTQNYLEKILIIDERSIEYQTDLKQLIYYLPDQFQDRVQQLFITYNLNPQITKIGEIPKEIKGIFVLLNLLKAKHKCLILDKVLDNTSLLHRNLVVDLFNEINRSNFIISNTENNAFLELYDHQL
ncbi:cysteine peptidase family C39 domain-containing protein [Ureaplasma ceti]|uniref:Cysteine peptidase family C39 domain-containing protein n=1 Tax=Ureaplasma ceti TaxID=3119530 RepID=A0ABP9U506_9BACT